MVVWLRLFDRLVVYLVGELATCIPNKLFLTNPLECVQVGTLLLAVYRDSFRCPSFAVLSVHL